MTTLEDGDTVIIVTPIFHIDIVKPAKVTHLVSGRARIYLNLVNLNAAPM